MEDDRALRQIAQRLSLRTPQRAALEQLAEIAAGLDLAKGADLAAAAVVVRAAAPGFTAFERDFPSLCFALATGVGKTRLMGAMIAWTYLTGRSRNFFVLAPNVTIYDKLLADFTPGTPKYVFKGIGEFSQNPPTIVTGDNYAGGAGLRRAGTLFDADVIINVFNVDKINSDKGRIRRLQEYIGQSYFEYLSGLPDLMMLMDEAHRYRAAAGMNAIAELRPVLGLELTATPKTVGAKPVPFRNVVYEYGLGDAMRDGLVKEPAVATRVDFQPAGLDEAALETIKLDDAVAHHDFVALELARYTAETGAPLVRPFILVVAQDTTHAKALRERIESEDFHGGRFKDRVIEVHSNTAGVESDKAARELLQLETSNATDIVIHVNKLKEGWDVNNLYTIVPLRASASDILTEQTLGRGLRLPFGRRTGWPTIDRLTVIAHDRFDAIIQAARAPGSIVMQTVTIGTGGDIPRETPKLVETPSAAEAALTGAMPAIEGASPVAAPIYTTEADRAVVRATISVAREEASRWSQADLTNPQVQARVTERVEARLAMMPGTLPLPLQAKPDMAAIVARTLAVVAERTIEIPEIIVRPTEDRTFGFHNFDLTNLDAITVQPISQELLVQELRTEARTRLRLGEPGEREPRRENYVVRHLIAYDEIDYDLNASLLYKLVGQVISRLETYISKDRLDDALLSHGKTLASFIRSQMRQHMWTTPSDYRATASGRLRLLAPAHLTATGPARDFRQPVTPKSETSKHVFTGFARCCLSLQKFQSDPERRFACLLERDDDVLLWVKPGAGRFQIDYNVTESYEPDFIVETRTEKLMAEVKARSEVDDPVVIAKAKAARKWCEQATSLRGTGKAWRYILVPDDSIRENTTLSGFF